MESKSSLNPQESLNLISETILKTKSDFRQNAFYFILWGWLVAVASIIHFALIQFTNFEYQFLPWPVLMTIGAIVSIWHGYSSSSHTETESYVNNFMKYLWIVLGSSFFIMVFICLVSGVHPTPFTLLLAGIGTLVSGLIMKFKPLTIGGIIFLGSSIAAIFIPESYQLILNAVAISAGYLIPAYLLKNDMR